MHSLAKKWFLQREDQGTPSRSWGKWGFLIFLALTVIVISGQTWALLQAQHQEPQVPVDPTLLAFATEMQYTGTPSATIHPPTPSATFTAAPTRHGPYGTLIYAARSAGRTSLWSFTFGDHQPHLLFNGGWDDRDPAVSPDGTKLAFSSHRTGNWELFLYDFQSTAIRQVTDTPGYEGHPTWSPDGQWLAYEVYSQDNFDIWILPVNLDQPPIQLTDHPKADLSPSWDPNGRRIAFVSDRDAGFDIFLADLDHPGDRFHNLTQSPFIAEHGPAFSPDGTRLAYSERSDGLEQIAILDIERQEVSAAIAGQGSCPAWLFGGDLLATIMRLPEGSYLQWIPQQSESIVPYGLPLIEGVCKIAWIPGSIQQRPELSISQTATPLFKPSVEQSNSDISRLTLVNLPGVEAPIPALSDAVDEAFNALRARTIHALGWDFLGHLENAFVGLNDPLPPGFSYNDWLYTGRAFAFDQAAFQAGWVEVVREDAGGQTYWRVFVRSATQDGSQGEPLRVIPWDFGARNSGNPQAYDQGGAPYDRIPAGYYVDFTQLAADYGFERLPAYHNWRTFYPATHFNEFAFRDGLSWSAAMLELYPAEAIVTPTPFQTPTSTPTRTPRPTATPWWWRWRTPTPSRTPIPYPSPTLPASP
jgi:TolB protein